MASFLAAGGMVVDPINLFQFEPLAKDRMDPGAWDYVAGGAGDEVTLRENREAFARFKLRPRVLVDVTTVDLATRVLGQPIEWPVMVAPTAFQTLAHPEGELAMARAAAASGTVMVVSTMASHRLEAVADAAPGPKWFQLYCYRDREVTRSLVERATAAGYRAICITVDLPRVGHRERDTRSGFHLPQHAQPANFAGVVSHSRDEFAAYIGSLVDPSLTWDLVPWLRSVTELPIVLKGIMTAEDAQRAAAHGVDGIIVSNHGGRQLDGVPATVDVLAEVVAATAGKLDVLMDGGVRRGTDVAKALALGARAVLIGRPCIWGLAVDGETGARQVLMLLREEVENALALLGCPSVDDITPKHVRL